MTSLPDSLPHATGSYLLILQMQHEQDLRVGKAGDLHAIPGFYMYTGSAFGPGGLRARAGRHLRCSSKTRWHIDYLRQISEPWALWFYTGNERMEHHWAGVLKRSSGTTSAMDKFGSSDCSCGTHLFYRKNAPTLESFQQQLKLDGLSSALNALVCGQ